MDWLKGHVEIGNYETGNFLRLEGMVKAADQGLKIALRFTNLCSKRDIKSFPEFGLLSIPSLTVGYSSGRTSENYLLTYEVPFYGFLSKENESEEDYGTVDLKPEESSDYLRYFCILEPDQWRRMRVIAQKIGILELKLLFSISLEQKTSVMSKNRTIRALMIPIKIPKADLEEFVSVWAKTRYSIKNLPEGLPEKVLLDTIEASKCLDIEVCRAAVVMSRRALQNALLLKGADKVLNLYDQINELRKSSIISNDIASLAHGVRYLGNFGAHPDDDLLNDVNFEDAKLAYQVVLKILKQLFQG